MALGSTRPQKWVPGVFPGGVVVKVVGASGWQPYHHPVPLSWNLVTVTSWNPLGHSRPVTGLLYLYLFYVISSLTFNHFLLKNFSLYFLQLLVFQKWVVLVHTVSDQKRRSHIIVMEEFVEWDFWRYVKGNMYKWSVLKRRIRFTVT